MPKAKAEEIINEQRQEQMEEEEYFSSQDEDAALLTDKVEEKLLQTLAKIKMKDPSIYQTKEPIYQDADFIDQDSPQAAQQARAKLTYKDLLIEGQEAEEHEQPDLPPAQEEKNAKAKFKKALELNITKMQNDEEDLFQVKQQAKSSKEQGGNEQTKSGKAQGEKEKFKELTKNFDASSKKLIKKVWNSEQLDETDLFLKSYILDKKWLSSKHKEGENQELRKIDQQDEERSVEMDQYEQQYNFRFQEPGGTTITQYPRDVRNSLRQKPETRKEKRKKLEQKKRQEQEQLRKDAKAKRQELKKDILLRLAPQGPQGEGQEQDYFFCDDCCRGLEEGEAVWQCTECEDFMLCSQCNQLIMHKHKLEEGTIAEGFGAPPSSESALQSLKSCRVCRRRITPDKKLYQYTDRSYIVNSMCEGCYDQSNLEAKKKFKLVQPQEPNFQQLLEQNPEKIKELTNHKQIQEMIDQYLKHDFEDVLSGGLKTKFKYIHVPAQSYGLSDEQILFGDDKQLNNYVSIKKLAPYLDQKVRLRNSVFNKKIKNIKRSVQKTKNLLQKGFARLARMRYIGKRKNRATAIRKRLQKRLRIVNLSNKQTERDHFVSTSRLHSYGIKALDNQN